MSEFHAQAPQAPTSEGLAHDPYMAAGAGFEPTTLPTKCAELTNEPPRPNVDGEVIAVDKERIRLNKRVGSVTAVKFLISVLQ